MIVLMCCWARRTRPPAGSAGVAAAASRCLHGAGQRRAAPAWLGDAGEPAPVLAGGPAAGGAGISHQQLMRGAGK